MLCHELLRYLTYAYALPLAVHDFLAWAKGMSGLLEMHQNRLLSESGFL